MNKMKTLCAGVLGACLYVLAVTQPTLADGATSLGIHGCDIVPGTLIASEDSRLVFAGCKGPKGLFYSLDQGRNWRFAGGSDEQGYQSGELTGLAMTAAEVYASFLISGQSSSKSDVAASLQSFLEGAPSYRAVPKLEHFRIVQAIGGYVVLQGLTSSPAEGTLAIFNPGTGAVSAGISMPSGCDVLRGGDGNYIFAGPSFSANAPRQIHRLSFNKQSGAIGGAWETVDFSAAPGFPVAGIPMQTAVAPSNALYLFLQGEPFRLFVSADFGQSFSIQQLPQHSGWWPGRSPAFTYDSQTGALHILIDSFISHDGGVSWADLAQHPAFSSSYPADSGAQLLQPKTAGWALFSSVVGLNRVTGLDGAPVLETANKGFEAAEMYALAKSGKNPNNALISSRSAYAITTNFLSEFPDWFWPYCPDSRGCFTTGGPVAADPNDGSVFYTVNFGFKRINISSLPPSAEEYISQPPGLTCVQIHSDPDTLPNTVVLAFEPSQAGVKAGGLYFYDVTKPPLSEPVKRPIDGEPVSRFIAVSAQTMFVVKQDYSGGLTGSRKIFRSTDGGATFGEAVYDLGSKTITNFAYDRANDILYASFDALFPEPSGVLRLKNAAAGNGLWEVPGLSDFAHLNRTTGIAVDGMTGQTVLAGISNMRGVLWFSDSHGDTWGRPPYSDPTPAPAYTGLNMETIRFVSYDEVIQGSGTGAKTAERSKRFGSSTGLYALTQEPAAAPVCSLKTNKQCTKKVRAGTKCSLTATLEKSAATAKTSVSIEHGKNAARGFRRLISKYRASKGVKTVKLTVAATRYYRAKFTSPACLTTPVRIQVK